MDLSIIAPAHRTKYWKEFYNSIDNYTNLDYEIIFVTDSIPKEEEIEGLYNLRWIFSTVKPVQCVEIALRETKGDLIHWSADDTTYNIYCFDKAVDLYNSFNNYRTMVAFRNFEDGYNKESETTEIHRFFSKDAPRMMPYGIISKKLIEESGGIDRRFIAGQWENDLVMRAYSIGGKMKLSQNSIAYSDHRKHLSQNEHNLRETWEFETQLLKSLWMNSDEKIVSRTSPIEKFNDNDLYTVSQGNKGKWI